ncbi:hypothetical protein AB0N31_09585 [Streptomyces sp. NPDC051051]|uniref:effector-associated constant component EACC1 n=1 Tax=Streptomyces sp. NPDC051051 TaxID=3155666 RepID=UPI003417B4EE
MGGTGQDGLTGGAPPADGPVDGPVEASPPAAPLLVAGRYRPVRFLGRGGMGVVHEAEDTRLDRPAAAPPPPGGMGTGFDVLQFAVSGGLSAASLVVSVLQWQASLRRAPAVTLRRGDVEVLLTARAARDERTVRRLVALPDGDAAPVAPPAPRTEGSGGDDGTP